MRVVYSILARLALFCAIGMLVFANKPAVNAEEFAFETEVTRVMDIIINSLYKTKEIFLRELISNASDAIEKMRILSLKNPDINKLVSGTNFNISIYPDPQNGNLIIQDNGIGMTYKDLKNNLGTIAKSGTAEFLAKKVANPTDQSFIGQFGVGFYSAFLVADSIHVHTKHPEDKQYVWHSSANNKFDIKEDVDPDVVLEHGTRIILKLKSKDGVEFNGEKRLKELISHYSEFINFPIYLNTTKEIEIDAPEAEEDDTTKEIKTDASEDPENEKKTDAEADVDDATKEKKEPKAKKEKTGDDDDDDEDLDEEEAAEKDSKTAAEPVKKEKLKIKQTVHEMLHINVQRPIWTREPKSLEAADHNKFFKAVFKESADPFKTIHFRGEGTFEFHCMVFIPRRPEHNIMQITAKNYERNVRLFVSKVFITEELLDFLPRFLGFLKGVIDSDDFPLNVSRETILKSDRLTRIRDVMVTKVIKTIEEVSKNTTEYMGFYNEYSGYIKMGVMESENESRKMKLASLLRFTTTNNVTESAPKSSFKEYISRIRKNQNEIYYLTGDSVQAMLASPYLEKLVKRGFEVVLMDDGLDDYLMQRFRSFGKFQMQNIAQGEFKFSDETDIEKEAFEESKKRFEPLTKFFTTLLSKSVDETMISRRLTTFSCALVAPSFGWTGRFQRIMSNHKNNEGMNSFYMGQKKKFEINPHHPIMMSLLAKVEADAVDKDVEDLARSLYDIALIAGNYPIDDVSSLTKRIENAVRLGLGVDLTSEAKVEVRPAPEIDTDVKIPNFDDDAKDGDAKDGESGYSATDDSDSDSDSDSESDMDLEADAAEKADAAKEGEDAGESETETKPADTSNDADNDEL